MNDELSPGSGTSGQDAAAASPAGPDTEPEAHAGPPTAGGLIRAARQAQGLDLASLAAMLKIPLRKIEALENDRHEDLQGPTFERALAQAACRVLKIDPKPVLALLPQVAGNTLEHVTGGLNKPFRERQARVEMGDAASLLLRPSVVLTALIVAAAVVLFIVPTATWTRLAQPVLAALAPAPAPAASAPHAATAPTATTAAAPADTRPASDAITTATAMPTATTLAATAPATAAGPTPAAASGVDEVLAHAVPPPTIPLQVTAIADSWVEVIDAQGHSLLSRTVVAGEAVGLDGAMPMKVKVGNARGTRLTLRGDNVDLTPWTRDNVARLELK